MMEMNKSIWRRIIVDSLSENVKASHNDSEQDRGHNYTKVLIGRLCRIGN